MISAGVPMTDMQGVTMDGVRYETIASPSFTTLVCHLAQGQSMVAEAGAMMFMHRTIEVMTTTRGGILNSLTTSMLGGESFFINTFTAVHGNGDVAFVGPGMGDMRPIEIGGRGWILHKSAYVCGSPSVVLDTRYQGLRGFISEGSFFMLYANGQGTVFVNSFGSILAKNLAPGEILSVDNGHIVAFPEGMPYAIRRIGGLRSTFLSGEGLVVDFTGPGSILLQTRQLGTLAQSLMPYMPRG